MRRLLAATACGAGLLTASLAQAQSLPVPGVKPRIPEESPLILRLERQGGGDPGEMDLASDYADVVWLTLPHGGPRLAYFDYGRWQTVKLPGFADTLRASQLLRLASGTVACLWKDSGRQDGWVLSRHHRQDHSIWCRLELKPERPRLLALADGSVLITEAGRKVVRIRPDGVVKRLELPESFFITPKKNDDGSMSSSHVQVHAVQDSGGRVWLWSYALDSQEYQWRLRGLVRLDDDTFRMEKMGDIDPAMPLSAIVPWEAGTLAVSVSGQGLFQFDPARQSARQILGQSEELKYIQKIFRVHGEWHFVTTPRPTKHRYEMSKTLSNMMAMYSRRFYDPDKRSTAILRLRDDKLDVLTWKLDAEVDFGWADRPVVETPEGFWIGAKDNGLLFVMRNEEGVLARRPFDWRNGLSLSAPRLLAKAGGYLVAAAPASAIAVAVKATAPLLQPLPSRLDVVEASSVLLEDTRGGLLGVLRDGAFHRWKAGHWEKTQAPPRMEDMAGNELVQDGAGQAWYIPRGEGAAAVCDLASGQWQAFDSLEEALQARLKPGGSLLPRNRVFPAPSATPADLPRRVGFLRNAGTLHLFDDGRWRSWKLSDIAGPGERIHAALRFDAAGQLMVPLGGTWWKLGANGQWLRTGDSTEGVRLSRAFGKPVVPEGCPLKNVVASAYDRLGVCWLMDHEHRLWKCVHGAAVQALQPGEINPAAGGLSLEQVLVDEAGNTFLMIPSFGSEPRYLVVRPRLSQPESKARLKKVDADTAVLELGQAAWHAWRLDGGKWSAATNQKNPALSGLTPGAHELEVMAYNEDLTPAPRPVVLKLAIRPAEQGDVDKAIAAFSSGDLELCEAAARRLRTQGDLVLPLLRNARQTADERARWWLDAVIQHIERKQP